MKKILPALIISVMIIFAFCGCGDTSSYDAYRIREAEEAERYNELLDEYNDEYEEKIHEIAEELNAEYHHYIT